MSCILSLLHNSLQELLAGEVRTEKVGPYLWPESSSLGIHIPRFHFISVHVKKKKIGARCFAALLCDQIPQAGSELPGFQQYVK